MKTLLIGLLVLGSVSAFGKDVIRHKNCRLNVHFVNPEVGQILIKNGYKLYSTKLESGTLELVTSIHTKDLDWSEYCSDPKEQRVKVTRLASVNSIKGKKIKTLSTSKISQTGCLEHGLVKNDLSVTKTLINDLAKCVIK